MCINTKCIGNTAFFMPKRSHAEQIIFHGYYHFQGAVVQAFSMENTKGYKMLEHFK